MIPPALVFAQGSGWPRRHVKTPVTVAGRQRQAEYDGAGHIVAAIALAGLLT